MDKNKLKKYVKYGGYGKLLFENSVNNKFYNKGKVNGK
jgi:hypothetical protein